MELMYRSAAITAVSAEIVRKADVFRVQFGTDRRILHRPQPAPVKDGPDNWRGVYAVAKLLHGEPDFEYLSREKVEEARSRSNSWRKFKSDGVPTPWSTDPEEMWRKTAIRRLAKRMPKNSSDKRSELLRAVILDEYGERRLLKPTLGGFETLDEPEEEKEKPIEPTLEAQLQESIEDVEKRKAQVAAKNKPPTKSTKKIQPNAADNQVPKAAIPPESKIDDPYLTGKQQTDVYNAALQAGWRVPEEITEYIKKTFKVNSIREVRNSQFAQLMRKAKGDEK
jgi:recombinational DNA repair protein RecT